MRQWLQFGPYRLDVAALALFSDDTPVSVTPKAIEVLRVLADAGGSVVTKEMLFDQVWAGTFVEESSITKNISELRAALAQAGDGVQFIETLPRRGYRLAVPVERIFEGGVPVRKKTLGVLPFRTLGHGFDDDSIGLRIADAVITRLATAKAFSVLPTRAVSYYPKSSGGAATAGKDLHADLILDGSVQRMGGTIRFTVQLLDGGTCKPVWGDTFDREFHDLRSVEDAFVEELTGALILFVGAENREHLSRRHTDNPEAYQFYLRGCYHLSRRSGGELRLAIEWFRKAIGLDPEYALAYAGLATSYAMLPMLASVRARHYMPRARSAAVKALDLDDALVEGHNALAMVKWHYEYDWRWAEREFKLALKFQPEHVTAHQWYALLLVEMGRGEEGIAEARKAQLLDPVSATVRANLSSVLYLAGRYPESIDTARETLALDSSSLRARWMLGMSLTQRGDLQAAMQCFEEACGLSGDAPHLLGALGYVYGIAGRRQEAASVLKKLRRHRPRYCFLEEALVTLGQGNLTEAAGLLERACDERQFHVVILRQDARFEPLRALPEFRAVLSRVGLADEGMQLNLSTSACRR